MSWLDIWRRLVLLLRSRLSRHRTCEECGWLLTRVSVGGSVADGSTLYEWRCEDCLAAEGHRKALESIRASEERIARERQQQRIYEEARALAGRNMDKLYYDRRVVPCECGTCTRS